mgnify:CR=1 FL=1
MKAAAMETLTVHKVLSVRPVATPSDPMDELNKGFYVTAGLSLVLLTLICFIMLPEGQWQFALCGLVGLKPSLGRVPIDPPYIGRAAGPMSPAVQ